jgi:hypothetical protein
MPFAMWGIFDLYNTEVLATNGVQMPDGWDSLLGTTRKMTRYDGDGTVKTYGYATYNILDVDPGSTGDLEPKRVVGPSAGQDMRQSVLTRSPPRWLASCTLR